MNSFVKHQQLLSTLFLDDVLQRELKILPSILEKATSLEKERFEFLSVIENKYAVEFVSQILAEEFLSSYKIESFQLYHLKLQDAAKKLLLDKSLFLTTCIEDRVIRAAYEALSFKHPLSVVEILKVFDFLNADDERRVRLSDAYVVKNNAEIVYAAPPPEEVDRLLELYCSWWKNHSSTLPSYLLSILLHLFFVLIHPFKDGNGRMSRLLALVPLQTRNFKVVHPTSSSIYESRQVYYTSLRNIRDDKNLENFLSTMLDFQKSSFRKSVLQYQQLRKLEDFFENSPISSTLAAYDKNLLRFFVTSTNAPYCSYVRLSQDFDSDNIRLYQSYKKLVDMNLIQNGQVKMSL